MPPGLSHLRVDSECTPPASRALYESMLPVKLQHHAKASLEIPQQIVVHADTKFDPIYIIA